jgi:hypothetical protein
MIEVAHQKKERIVNETTRKRSYGKYVNNAKVCTMSP